MLRTPAGRRTRHPSEGAAAADCPPLRFSCVRKTCMSALTPSNCVAFSLKSCALPIASCSGEDPSFRDVIAARFAEVAAARAATDQQDKQRERELRRAKKLVRGAPAAGSMQHRSRAVDSCAYLCRVRADALPARSPRLFPPALRRRRSNRRTARLAPVGTWGWSSGVATATRTRTPGTATAGRMGPAARRTRRMKATGGRRGGGAARGHGACHTHDSQRLLEPIVLCVRLCIVRAPLVMIIYVLCSCAAAAGPGKLLMRGWGKRRKQQASPPRSGSAGLTWVRTTMGVTTSKRLLQTSRASRRLHSHALVGDEGWQNFLTSLGRERMWVSFWGMSC